jgi:hypothetical protein
MELFSRSLKIICIFSFLISASVFAQEHGPKKGEITLASIPSTVWGSYTISQMLFPNEQWKFYVVVVPKDVRQGTLIEMAKDFYSKFPKTRARFFSDQKHIQQFVNRDRYVNDRTGSVNEVAYPDTTWVKNHLLGNINNRSKEYSRHWMLENRYGSRIELLP